MHYLTKFVFFSSIIMISLLCYALIYPIIMTFSEINTDRWLAQSVNGHILFRFGAYSMFFAASSIIHRLIDMPPVWRNGNCLWINLSQLLQRFSLDISHCNALVIDIHHWYLTNFPLWLVVSTVNLYIYIFPQTWVHYECHYLRHGLNSVGKIIKYHPCLD